MDPPDSFVPVIFSSLSLAHTKRVGRWLSLLSSSSVYRRTSWFLSTFWQFATRRNKSRRLQPFKKLLIEKKSNMFSFFFHSGGKRIFYGCCLKAIFLKENLLPLCFHWHMSKHEPAEVLNAAYKDSYVLSVPINHLEIRVTGNRGTRRSLGASVALTPTFCTPFP